MTTSAPAHLVGRQPQMSGADMAAQLVPPRQFAHASFENYVPDADHPSQQEALDALRAFSVGAGGAGGGGGGFFGKKKKKVEPVKPGIYLDGGFGVGKTHLLAALWHRAGGVKHFGTFIEYTALVGAVGYQGALKLLGPSRLICIDEFELDDPGDTMLMTRLLGELAAGGTRLAATSNTPPNALGEGRFAAQDFLREIHALSDRFQILRIDGDDYRRRESDAAAHVSTEADVADRVTSTAGATIDDFDALLAHLATVHPSRYVRLLDGVPLIGVTGVHPLANQTDALRLVAFIDRVYDAQIPMVTSGTPLDSVFGEDMLAGGYRKKYQRSISRIIALTSAGSSQSADSGVHAG